ncbi:MAG: NTP transferase domain-containing protein [Candidatus Woesearchaeota archaeon]
MRLEEIAKLHFVLMAGGGPDTMKVDGRNKCFAVLQGRQVFEYGLDALFSLGAKNISVTCSDEDSSDITRYNGHVNILESNKQMSLAERLLLLADGFKAHEPVALLYGDHPFVSAKSLTHSLIAADLAKADLFLPVIPSEFESVFSHYQPHDYVYFKEFKWYHSPLIIAKPANLDLRHLRKVAGMRKVYQKGTYNSVKTYSNIIAYGSWHLGPRIVPAVLASPASKMLEKGGFDSLAHYVRRLAPASLFVSKTQKLFNAPCSFLVSCYGELALEIDRPSHIEPFREHFFEIQEKISSTHDLIESFHQNAEFFAELAKYNYEDASNHPRVREIFSNHKAHPLVRSLKINWKNALASLKTYNLV